jgi:hypothetical protein
LPKAPSPLQASHRTRSGARRAGPSARCRPAGLCSRRPRPSRGRARARLRSLRRSLSRATRDGSGRGRSPRRGRPGTRRGGSGPHLAAPGEAQRAGRGERRVVVVGQGPEQQDDVAPAIEQGRRDSLPGGGRRLSSGALALARARVLARAAVLTRECPATRTAWAPCRAGGRRGPGNTFLSLLSAGTNLARSAATEGACIDRFLLSRSASWSPPRPTSLHRRDPLSRDPLSRGLPDGDGRW